jgi:hypothetical protein
MSIDVNATYRDGAIHPETPLGLPENTPVRVHIVPQADNVPPAAKERLGGDLRALRAQIVASGAVLLDEESLDHEKGRPPRCAKTRSK